VRKACLNGKSGRGKTVGKGSPILFYLRGKYRKDDGIKGILIIRLIREEGIGGFSEPVLGQLNCP